MNKEKRTIVKITLYSGRILTVEISKQTENQIIGTDKFDKPVIISISDIKTMIPMEDRK